MNATLIIPFPVTNGSKTLLGSDYTNEMLIDPNSQPQAIGNTPFPHLLPLALPLFIHPLGRASMVSFPKKNHYKSLTFPFVRC